MKRKPIRWAGLSGFRAELRHRISVLGSQRAFARAYGFSHVYVCQVVRGKRPSVRLMRRLGFKKVVLIQRIQ